jgi:hypothetical protein
MLDELDDLQMIDRVHADIWEISKDRLRKAHAAIGFAHVREQLLVGRPSGPRVDASAKDHRLYDLAFGGELGSCSAETENLVVRMRDHHQIELACRHITSSVGWREAEALRVARAMSIGCPLGSIGRLC